MTLLLAALAGVEIVASPGAARTVLEGGLALGAFGAMALWARWNRVALDQQAWCDCAARTVSLRVIPSRRPGPAGVEPRGSWPPPGPGQKNE